MRGHRLFIRVHPRESVTDCCGCGQERLLATKSHKMHKTRNDWIILEQNVVSGLRAAAAFQQQAGFLFVSFVPFRGYTSSSPWLWPSCSILWVARPGTPSMSLMTGVPVRPTSSHARREPTGSSRARAICCSSASQRFVSASSVASWRLITCDGTV